MARAVVRLVWIFEPQRVEEEEVVVSQVKHAHGALHRSAFLRLEREDGMGSWPFWGPHGRKVYHRLSVEQVQRTSKKKEWKE